MQYLDRKRLLECTLCRSVCAACIAMLGLQPLLLVTSFSYSRGPHVSSPLRRCCGRRSCCWPASTTLGRRWAATSQSRGPGNWTMCSQTQQLPHPSSSFSAVGRTQQPCCRWAAQLQQPSRQLHLELAFCLLQPLCSRHTYAQLRCTLVVAATTCTWYCSLTSSGCKCLRQ